MECGKQNIKIVEGNEFALVLPLKQRTFVASIPIDEDIVYADLQDVVLKIGDTQFTATLETYGVQVLVPYNALPRGTYDILLTATYHGSKIQAAYFEALTRVQYNSQSDAQQYIAGSPIVLDAAYVIGGTLTDAELEALKEEYREKNAQLAQAIEDAEEAKEHYDQLAEQLTGVAQEETLTQGVQAIRDDISHIDIDTSDLAKQGTNPNATLTDTQTAAQNAETAAGQAKQAADDAKAAALALPSAQEIAQAVIAGTSIPLNLGGIEFVSGHEQTTIIGALLNFAYIYRFTDTETVVLNTIGYPFQSWANLHEVHMLNCEEAMNVTVFRKIPALEYANLPKLRLVSTSGTAAQFYNCPNLKKVNVSSLAIFPPSSMFGDCHNLIDLITGANFTSSVNLKNNWDPTNAYNSSLSTLVTDTEDEFGNPITNNLQQLLYNIRRHFAANLPDRTGLSSLTITFHANMKAAIQADTATSNAFTNKNWTIA